MQNQQSQAGNEYSYKTTTRSSYLLKFLKHTAGICINREGILTLD